MNELSGGYQETSRIPVQAEDIAEMADRIPEARRDIRPRREEIAALATFIAREFRPRQVVLFGSRVHGTPTPDSDVDLLVVIDTLLRPIEQAIRIRQAIDLPHPFPLDIIVRTPAQIELGLAEGDFFIRDVMTEGVVLFEAGDAGMGG